MYMFVMLNVPGSEGGSWLRSSESLNDSEGFCGVPLTISTYLVVV